MCVCVCKYIYYKYRRKIFSTVYSVFRNPDNSLNEMQWTGCGLVFFGILFEMAAGMVSGKEKSH